MVDSRALERRASQAKRSKQHRGAVLQRLRERDAELDALRQRVAELERDMEVLRESDRFVKGLIQMREAYNRLYTVIPQLVPWSGKSSRLLHALALTFVVLLVRR